ncbi:sulfite exporter TauE/SafE family protein [Desulfogranum mediterraneum]|uniref:sulfite exporter TauE/SafE family protein n=1 Tax=Desulfogranum mediterraneum TaxID=160661 RepID=UPI00041A01C8|nr:sulfite exporter TauE/SafE family protein [Desulfogranum mediterraneum]
MELSWTYGYAMVVIFIASLVRGYSGFGFAMISTLTLALVFPPAQVVPVILILDVVASFWLISKVWQSVDWKSLALIISGAILTLPLGSLALTLTPIRPMRIFLSLTILLLCLGLLANRRPCRETPRPLTLVVGMVSGFLTGVAAIGGPPVILFYFSSGRAVSVSRASMIVFFFLVDSLAVLSSLWYGLLNQQTLSLSLGLFIPLGLGIWSGNYLFNRLTNEASFRRQVLILLATIACLSLLKALIN